jgi:uncharacterized protein (TIGR00106 family)
MVKRDGNAFKTLAGRVTRFLYGCHVRHTNNKKIYSQNSGLAAESTTRIPEQWQGVAEIFRNADCAGSPSCAVNRQDFQTFFQRPEARLTEKSVSAIAQGTGKSRAERGKEESVSVILELSLFPMDKGASVSPYVARAVDIIRRSGLASMLTPMGTCVEGEWDEVWAVAGDCFKAVAADADRVYMTVKADYRRGREAGLRGKLASVERRLEDGSKA